MIDKKGQQEIAGFVAIIIIVAVIALVLLGILIRNNSSNPTESKDINNFIESSMRYTTDCTISYVPDYSQISDLIKECFNSNVCLDGRNSCDVLNKTLQSIIDSNWRVNGGSLKGYNLNITASSNSDPILILSRGECASSIVGSDYILPGFKISFDACY